MEYMVNRRINNIVLKLTLSLLQLLSFFNFYSCFCTEESINDFVSLLLMLVELIVLFNLADLIKKRDFLIEFSLLSVILFARLNILNAFLQFKADRYVGIVFVLISAVTHIYIIRNIDDNSEAELRESSNNKISAVEIEKYTRNKFLNLFNLIKAENNEDNNTDVQKYIWITFSGLIAIVLFLGKFIIDIKNIFSMEYTFDKVFIVVYVLLNITFIVINYIKSKIVGCNKIIDFVETILFLSGANLFVFAQREYARFQVLVVVAYLCSLYLLKIRNLIKELEAFKKFE